jgi:hypothetical protein
MSVLVEAISIIILRRAIDERYIGGWNGFVADIPNRTVCDDGEIVRVGFMDGSDAILYVENLQSKGLRFTDDADETFVDFAIVDQMEGMKLNCEWLDVHQATFFETGIEIKKCSLKGSAITAVYLPDGWEYAGSLSQKCSYTPPNQEDNNMKFLRHEDGVDVYLDLTTGEECYMGRTLN